MVGSGDIPVSLGRFVGRERGRRYLLLEEYGLEDIQFLQGMKIPDFMSSF